MSRPPWILALLVILSPVTPMISARAEDLDARLAAMPLIEEIDAAAIAPIHQYPEAASRVTSLLGRPARVLDAGDSPKTMAWVIGKGKNLRPGSPYVLEVEYPDDVPRTIFVANRGADLVRGFATGAAIGDARQQYVQPSVESVGYPQSGTWQTYRTIFFLHDRFQGLYAQRDAKPGGRPFTPADGFHVVVFQAKRLNDPPSRGAAVGKIRLRAIPNVAALYPEVEPLPEGLPKRRIFFREEMADEAISARVANDRGVADPLNWLLYKARMSRVLAINTFAKDLLEFGHNQGWKGGDPDWINDAQPPMTDLWDRAASRLAGEGLDLLPYFEYKGAIGRKEATPPSLGWQRRAEKLYHNLPNARYTPVWWTEDHNADLTDPATLDDVRRVVDRTILAHKGRATFAGAWFRVRDNHLPISFSEAAVERFRAAHHGDSLAATASRRTLIASYESDRKLYDRYVGWWLGERRRFFEAIADHLAKGLGDDSVRVWFTPWTSEQIPMLRDPGSGPNGHPVQVTTDDVPWWDAFARTQPDSGWFRWALSPTSFDRVVAEKTYAYSLSFREAISPAPDRTEGYHSAPGADPIHYRDSSRVMLTFPMARLFTVADPELLTSYRTRSGLTAIRHYTLNEDDHDRAKGPSNLPFDGQVGYASVDVDRAGPFVRLLEARAVAAADPTYLGSLCASSFSTGFPGRVQRFNAAFLSVPALPSTLLKGACQDPAVVVRHIPTAGHGTYYLVVNTAMKPARDLSILLPARGQVRDLVEHRDLAAKSLRLTLEPGELRTYRDPQGR
ncbi:hypothetical protein OJF2_53010 [Aquisphaera giovannonii]|uniref:Uncharacterized protein n=1 Tax=Aquisphaera giovannonii TaxID=406548 RepID=A0A5B9W7Q6_9BACT|nr:hypothetical protein [Aquisphaera giovannonii]QEH36716.1 hypothetical protein OJF2_53010 [Aquisphaera giovannonii]